MKLTLSEPAYTF